MQPLVLITGGAGFIGSHLADHLLAAGYRVRALDNLAQQVHGADSAAPGYLHGDVELIVGDLRDGDVVRRALAGVDAVAHLAAAVGVGQSMYELTHYTAANNLGTAVLLQALLDRPVARLVVASSMSLYGEGLYRRSDGTAVECVARSVQQLRRGEWEMTDANGERLSPVPTPEWKVPSLTSIYALSKYGQERMCLIVGKAYRIPTMALRLFNVYGPRQALSNPYTGVLAIFAARLLNDKPPLIFEDGLQRRDFVSVHDVARGFRLALEADTDGEVLNIGSGQNHPIAEIAERLATVVAKPYLKAEIAGKYRVGDIRHCFADIARAEQVLGYAPQVQLEDGLADLAEWLASQRAEDRVEQASAELAARGLTV